MSSFEIKIIKDRKDELEIEFKERFTKKIETENLNLLSEEEWKEEEKKDMFYKEVSSKELPEVLKAMLLKRGVDAYTHEPHYLNPSYRLTILAKDPKKELKKAINDAERAWSEFEKLLEKKIK